MIQKIIMDTSNPKRSPNPNCISTGISERFLTPCRRIGLSRSSKTPKNAVSKIYKTEKKRVNTDSGTYLDSNNATPNIQRSTSTENDITCTTRNITKPNDSNDAPKPKPQAQVETTTKITCDTIKIGTHFVDLPTLTAKKALETRQTAVTKLDTSKKYEDEDLRNTPITKSKAKNNKKSSKIINNKTKNENNVLPNNDRKTGDKNNLILKPENSKGKKRIFDKSDSDFETAPPIKIATKAHHPPAKIKRTTFRTQKTDKSDNAPSQKSPHSQVTETHKLTKFDAIERYLDDTNAFEEKIKRTNDDEIVMTITKGDRPEQTKKKEFSCLCLSVIKDDRSSIHLE